MDTNDEVNTDDDAVALNDSAVPVKEGEPDAGIVAELGALPPGAIVNEDALARIFKRHPASIKRAVTRGELPAPARLLGGNSWTAGAIVRYIERRMDDAAKEAERAARRLDALRP